MTTEDSLRPKRPPTTDLSDLVVPRRPAGVPYAQGEDYDAKALLSANGYELGSQKLVETLDSELVIFQAAAARLLGMNHDRSSIPALKRIGGDLHADETVRVQAAYALARMDVPEGKCWLVDLAALNPEATPAPLQAAGSLANLGDPQAFAVVRAALDSDNRVVAMIACKQLYSFIPFAGRALPGGGLVVIWGAFQRALERSEPNINGEAAAQLTGLDDLHAQALLQTYREKEGRQGKS